MGTEEGLIIGTAFVDLSAAYGMTLIFDGGVPGVINLIQPHTKKMYEEFQWLCCLMVVLCRMDDGVILQPANDSTHWSLLFW